MSRSRRACLVLAVALLAHGFAWRATRAVRAGSSAPEEARALDATLPRAVARIAPSLVRVRPAGDSEEARRRARTGVAIEPDLVLMDADSLPVTGVEDLVVEDLEGKTHAVAIRGRDSRLRIVALEIEGELKAAPRCPVTPEPGKLIVATGAVYAHDGKPSAALGIVSAVSRFEGRAIQIDAAIDPSNGGGAVVDLEGALVGIAVLVDRKLGDGSGVAFCVPIARIVQVLPRLRAGEDLGPGVLGIALPGEDPEIAPSLEGGVKIEGVVTGGPAKKAGLEVGDVIVRLDGRKVKSLRGLLALLSMKCAGDEVEVAVLREGREIVAKVVLGARK